MVRVTNALVKWLVAEDHCVKDASIDLYALTTTRLLADGTLSPDDYKDFAADERYEDTVAGKQKCFGTPKKDEDNVTTPEKLFAGRDGRVTVKRASEQYSEKRTVAKNKSGASVFDPWHSKQCETQSEQQAAMSGALLKHLAFKAGVTSSALDEHEKQLLADCANSPWAGKVGSEYFDEIDTKRHNIKALLDDSLSGGIEAVPIWFDENLVTFPLLNGELFPLVDLVPVPRGRRIEGASIQTPTMSWGGGDGSDIALFNTAALINSIDTTIQCVDGCIEVGRDTLSDSPAQIGSYLTALVGDRLTTELDKVVAIGNGTTQPEGLFTASGTTTITADNGNSGPLTVADFTELLFSLAKQYRRPALNVAFISNDTSYARSRAMKVDSAGTTDQRLALSPEMGRSLVDYTTLGFPHKVSNDIDNRKVGIAAMKLYRMYRRIGLELRWETGGKELARANTVLLVYRARFGGKLVNANGFAKWTNGQA